MSASSRSFLNQVRIPRGKSGSHEICHVTVPPGKPLALSNARNRLIGGQRHKGVVTYGKKTLWHELRYDGGTWMTDFPIEQLQCRDSLKRMRGRVLVGGLGLGLAANWLARRKSVSEIVVVEISKDVVNLVAPHIIDPRGVVKVVRSDLRQYLRSKPGRFSWAFYDIWQSDGETTLFDTVCPLREASVGVVNDWKVVCWNEDVMRGQLFIGLQTRIMRANAEKGALELLCGDDESVNIRWSVPFFRAYRNNRIKDLERAIRVYASMYGRPHFDVFWESCLKENSDE